ncbi:hypothetical protein HH110_05390 [Stenotrophomonas sp. SAM-B]|uniref:hypothetical protein n=1 Tax=Stenotrophomonas sp. SAM-B TaxID=2729141 RepID=UPI0015A3E3C0|nr:hypothetical protein [Stenotrophomonas sp. SAM-B]NWF32473.1 hypothetical protein [Stenotrophomonas sp. SAM-B]
MNLFGGLLFLQGHITNVALARQLAGVDAVDGETGDGPEDAAAGVSHCGEVAPDIVTKTCPSNR